MLKSNGRNKEPIISIESSDKWLTEESDLEIDTEEQFVRSTKDYVKRLRQVGYGFQAYLKTYVRFILKDHSQLLDEYLKMDLNTYDFAQDEVFLVGSLPGAYDNHVNYSYPSILKTGNLEYS